MKGRILCILLLSAWLTQSLFPVLYYQWERIECRKTFAQRKDDIPAWDLQTLIFSNKDEVLWEKQDREFVLQGRLYDVVSIRKEGHSIIITCVQDHQEEQLVEAYHQSLKKDKESKLKPPTRKIDWYTQHFLPFTIHRHFSTTYISMAICKLPPSFKRIILPPPKRSFG